MTYWTRSAVYTAMWGATFASGSRFVWCMAIVVTCGRIYEEIKIHRQKANV